MEKMPDACTLPLAERPARMAEFDDVFARSVQPAARLGPRLLRFTLDNSPETEDMAGDLAAREQSCCAFFDFALDRTDEGLLLDVEVPPAYTEVLDSLAARAAAVSGARR